MAKPNHAQRRTTVTIRYDRAPEMSVTLPAPPCPIEISQSGRLETAPRGKVIRSHQARPVRRKLHPLQVVLRAMMEGQ